MKFRCFNVVFLCILISCTSTVRNSKLIIAVVGDGVNVKEPRQVEWRYSINTAQGRAIWKGAKLAYDSTDVFKRFHEVIELKGFDDGGIESQAIEIANELLANQNVIAVIGHSTSGTTIEPSKIYSKGNIPLLMPISTSPYAGADKKKTLHNCFRLPLNDYEGQAPAVAYLATDYLQAKRIAIIQDISPDAPLYSEPLAKSVRCLLGSKSNAPKINEAQFHKDKYQEEIISGKIHSCDVVIFCGYGTNANVLLQEMRIFYDDTSLKKPSIILTDGCKVKDIDVTKFETYLTFPIGDLDSMDCQSKDFQLLKNSVPNKEMQSYHLHGFDAMLILGQIINDLSKEKLVSRVEMIKTLNEDKFFGACFQYAFRNGENTNSKYYIYYSDPRSIIQDNNFQFMLELSSDKLVQIRKAYSSTCQLKELL